METLSPTLKFFLNLARVNAVMARRFDGHLGGHHGLGFTDFVILHYLSEAPGEKLRRVDLAEKLGLTASGVTRLLAPMEKIGLIKREATEYDGRVSFVALAPGGKHLLSDALDTAEDTAQDIVPENKRKKLEELSELLASLPFTQIY